MKFSLKKIGKTKVEIGIESDWLELQEYYNKSLEKMSQGIVLDGFRPGKAPLDIVEQKIGSVKILEEAAEMFLQKHYPKLLRENNLEVIGQPQVEILKLAKGNDFICKIKAEILPEIRLPDYKKIASSVKKQEVKVEAEDVNRALEQLSKMNADFEDLQREAGKDDFVSIEYQSPQVENNKSFEDRFFLGKGQFAPGFEEKLEGMKENEEKEFSVDFPKDHPQKELAGKAIAFKVKLNKVQKAIFPEINDGFVKKLGNFSSLDELKKSIHDGLLQEKAVDESQKVRAEILKRIVEKVDIEVPEILIVREKEKIQHDLQHEVAEKLQASFEDYIKQKFETREKFDEFLAENAEDQVKNFLVLQEIGKKEKIEVNDAEVELAVNEFLKQYPNVEGVENQFDPIALKSYYRSVIWNEKIFQKLESYIENKK